MGRFRVRLFPLKASLQAGVLHLHAARCLKRDGDKKKIFKSKTTTLRQHKKILTSAESTLTVGLAAGNPFSRSTSLSPLSPSPWLNLHLPALCWPWSGTVHIGKRWERKERERAGGREGNWWEGYEERDAEKQSRRRENARHWNLLCWQELLEEKAQRYFHGHFLCPAVNLNTNRVPSKRKGSPWSAPSVPSRGTVQLRIKYSLCNFICNNICQKRG